MWGGMQKLWGYQQPEGGGNPPPVSGILQENGGWWGLPGAHQSAPRESVSIWNLSRPEASGVVRLQHPPTQPWRARGSPGGAEEQKSEARLERGCPVPPALRQPAGVPARKGLSGWRANGCGWG